MITTAASKFYRTAKGSKRHLVWGCANQRRAITSGDPILIPATEVKDWAPCKHCCPADLVAQERTAEAARTATKQAEQCANVSVRNPRRIQSECTSCGKRGTVNRSTGKLKGHKPQR